MNYSEKLADLKLNPDVLLREIGDEWRTPDDLFLGINQLYGPFVLDLFTDGDNAKCASYYTAQDNALVQPWAAFLDGGIAFANPPYSRSSYDQAGQPTTGMRHIVAKAMEERDKGARVVFLIKAAPSESWWPEHADHVCWIKGRVGFKLPLWAQHLKASSAGFGQAVVVFDKNWRGERERYIARDVLERQGQALMADIEQRAQQLAAAMVAAQAPALSPELTPLSSELESLSSELDATDTNDGTSEKCFGTALAEFLTDNPKEEVALALELEEDQLALESLTDEETPEPESLPPEPDPKTEFTPEELHQEYRSGKLKADNLPSFISFLVGMFGARDTYNIKQIQVALVAEASGGVSSVAIDGLDRRQQSLFANIGRALTFNDIEAPSQQVAAIAKIIELDAAHQIANDTQRQLDHREIQRALQPFTTKTVEFAL